MNIQNGRSLNKIIMKNIEENQKTFSNLATPFHKYYIVFVLNAYFDDSSKTIESLLMMTTLLLKYVFRIKIVEC